MKYKKRQFEKLKSTALLLDEFNQTQDENHVIQIESFTSKASNKAANTKVALTPGRVVYGVAKQCRRAICIDGSHGCV